MAFLLTWHGTLLCQHRQSGMLVHRQPLSIGDDVEPVVLDVPMERLHAGFGHHLRAELPDLPSQVSGQLSAFRLRWSKDRRTVLLAKGDLLLTADVHTEATATHRTEEGDWETFLPLSPADLDVLRTLLRSTWLIRSSGALVEQPSTWHFHNLRIGDLVVDLRHQVPFDLTQWPHRLTLLREGWRIEQICQYRPLVFYTAFGSPEIMQQFALSVRSLIEHGRYQGAILAMTDQTPAELARYVPPQYLPRIALLPYQPKDRMGFMAARYFITDWAGAWDFQPLLYVDTDTIFDADIAPMLSAIARSDRVTAPIEQLSVLATSPASGATLLQRDLCEPGYMAGFNSGTLGIPNLRTHAPALRLIQRLIMNYTLLNGRNSLPFADQEIANYVSYRLMHFDTNLISPFVRYAGTDASQGNRCGLVHFWSVHGAGPRMEAMRDYLEHVNATT